MTTLSLDRIVRVTAELAPPAAPARNFDRTLLVTTDITQDLDAGRVGVFASTDDVARVFPPDSSPYQAAQVYFSQVPYPRHLAIGRWVNNRKAAQLTGGSPRDLDGIRGRATVVRGSGTVAALVNFHGRPTVVTGSGTVADLVNFHGRATVVTGSGTVAALVNFHGRPTVVTGSGTVADLVNFHGRATVVTGSGTVAALVNFHGRATVVTGSGTVATLGTLQSITAGTVTFHGQTVTSLDFSGDNNLDDVANTLQTALRGTNDADLTSVEVAYDSDASQFVVSLPLDSNGDAITVSGAFTGDNADELGLDTVTTVAGVGAIKSGSVTFLSETASGIDFSAVTDYDGVATVLQTALRGATGTTLDAVEVAYDSDASAFVVTLPLDSDGDAVTVSGAFSGDTANELGLDTVTTVAGVDAIKSGSVTFLSETASGIDFSAVTDYDGVATVLQTALRGATGTTLDAVEVSYDSDASAFVVTLPLDSDGDAVTVSGAFSGDTADELGLDTVTTVAGVDAIQSGTVTFAGETATNIDFSAVTNYDDVANVLQMALRGATGTTLDAVEVVYDSDASAFSVTIPLAADGSATAVTTAFTGVTADELGLDTINTVAGVSAIQSGSVMFLGQTAAGLDLSAVTDYDNVAAVLQTALRATGASGLTAVEVAYDSDAIAFVVTVPLDSSGAATSVSSPFTGSEADELGLDTATIVDGISTITSGSVAFHGATVSGLDFSAVTDYDDVASVLQTALRGSTVAALAGVEVEYDGSQFVVVLPLGADGSATEVSGPFTGAVADVLGLDRVEITAGVDGIGAGSLTWQGYTVASLDFTAATSYENVAGVLQTALRDVRVSARADLRSATIEYSAAGFFRVSLGFRANGDPYPITGFMVDAAQEAASALGLASASGGDIDQGAASETIEEAMDAISGLDANWYFVAADSGITSAADLLALSRWVQSKPHMLALDVVDEGVLTPNESASLAERISILGSDRTALVWSRTADYKSLAVAGGMSSINLDRVNSLKTAKFLTLAGTTPDAIDETAKRELDRKRVNHYSPFGPVAIFAEGWTPGGFIESRLWLDWMISRIQLDVFNLLRSTRRVGLTPQGQSEIYAVIINACEAGRRNGGLASRQVSEAMSSDIRQSTGADFDGFLQRGYMVYAPPISALTQAQRDQRSMTPFRVWLAYTSFTHSLDIALSFES